MPFKRERQSAAPSSALVFLVIECEERRVHAAIRCRRSGRDGAGPASSLRASLAFTMPRNSVLISRSATADRDLEFGLGA